MSLEPVTDQTERLQIAKIIVVVVKHQCETSRDNRYFCDPKNANGTPKDAINCRDTP
jgi:hypothetical protein